MRTGLAVAGLVLGPLLVGCGAADPLPVTGSEQAIGAALAGASTTRSAAAKPEREPRGSEDWRISQQSQHGEVAAYTTLTSGLPGTPGRAQGLHHRGRLRGLRLPDRRLRGWDRRVGVGVGRAARPRAGAAAVRVVRDPDRGRSVDPRPDGRHLDVGAGVLRLPAPHRHGLGDPGAVRRDLPSAEGTVALVAPVTTWQAYNQWGGYSLYAGADGDSRSHAVSFDRPYNGATGANDYRTAAIPIIVRAEQSGVPLSYFTNIDLHTREHALDGARGYVSMGHDEYWTTAMREAVARARDAGTNLAFLGANTMYWRVRLEPSTTGPARLVGGLPARRAPRPVVRRGVSRRQRALQGGAGPAARARPARHAVRVLPRRHRLRHRQPRLVGIPGHRRPTRRPRQRAGRARGRPGLPGRTPAAPAAGPQPLAVLLPRRHDLVAVRLLHDALRCRRLQRRHPPVGVCARRPLRAPARGRHGRASSGP